MVRYLRYLLAKTYVCAVVVVVKASHPLSASNKMEAVGILLDGNKIVDALLYILGKETKVRTPIKIGNAKVADSKVFGHAPRVPGAYASCIVV